MQKDYKALVLLKDRVVGLGDAAELYVVARYETEAKEAAEYEFKELTRLPARLIESIEVKCMDETCQHTKNKEAAREGSAGSAREDWRNKMLNKFIGRRSGNLA